MTSFKNYCKEFFTEESGMELLQFAIVVVVTVGLIGVVVKLGSSISKQIGSSADAVDAWDTNNPLGGGSGAGAGGGGTTPTP